MDDFVIQKKEETRNVIGGRQSAFDDKKGNQ